MRFRSTGSPAASASRRTHEAAVRDGRGEAGFTLIETVIALVILAVSLTALYQSSQTSTRAISTASGHLRARLLAQALINEQMGGSRRFTAGNWSGVQEGGLAWVVQIEPAREGWVPPAGPNNRWTVFRIRVGVSWARGREITLETLRLGAAK